MVEQNTPEFLKSWSAEINSKANRVRNLIGNAHWLSDGNHKETLIRSFIRTYVPDHLSICHGFVKDSDRLSKQQDILIVDPSVDPPFLREDDFQVVPQTSVVATIEVKSNFSRETLKIALENVASVKQVVKKSTFSCICFCSAEQEPVRLLDTIREVVEQFEDDYPTVIASLSEFCCFLKATENGNKMLNFFESGELSFAIAITDMLEHVRLHLGHAARGTMSKLIEEFDEIKCRKINI